MACGAPHPSGALDEVARSARPTFTSKGFLFWAEQRVASGIAAIMLATIPAFTALSEVILSRKLALPSSKAMSAASQMVTGGALLFIAAALSGEFHHFRPLAVTPGGWLALLYLIVAGSIMGFTAYLWLLHHQSPTHVGTYAYVNPVVAILIGYFIAGEPLSLRTVVGSALVLISVIVIATTRSPITTVTQTLEEAR